MVFECQACHEQWSEIPDDKTCPACGGRDLQPLPCLRLRTERLGKHLHATVFMGEDCDHLASCGKLVMLEREWTAFQQALVSSQRFEIKE